MFRRGSLYQPPAGGEPGELVQAGDGGDRPQGGGACTRAEGASPPHGRRAQLENGGQPPPQRQRDRRRLGALVSGVYLSVKCRRRV
eukprot:7450493-Pyramimonas_sp.AAC.1